VTIELVALCMLVRCHSITLSRGHFIMVSDPPSLREWNLQALAISEQMPIFRAQRTHGPVRDHAWSFLLGFAKPQSTGRQYSRYSIAISEAVIGCVQYQQTVPGLFDEIYHSFSCFEQIRHTTSGAYRFCVTRVVALMPIPLFSPSPSCQSYLYSYTLLYL